MLETLIRFLPMAEKVINRKTTLPILSQLCVKDGYISATDLENTVRIKTDDTRHYTIPLDILKTIMKTKPKQLEVSVLEDGRVQIRYDLRTITFKSMDAGEFPITPKGKFRSLGKWTPIILKQLYAQLPYTSTEMLKPALTGVFVHQNGALLSNATDGHILRQIMDVNIHGKAKLKNRFKGILPKKALQILSRMVKNKITVAVSGTHLRFKLAGDIEFYVRLIDEKYPDVDTVIPKEFSGSVSLNKEQFMDLVKDAKPFANRETKLGEFRVKNPEIKVLINDAEKEISWNSDLPIKGQYGEDLTIGLNVTLLEKVLNGIDETEVLWQYGSPVTAGVFTGVNGTDVNTLHLLMPIRLEKDT